MRTRTGVIALAVLAACSDSSGPKVGPPTTLLITAGGTAQTGSFGTAVPIAPTVLVTDANNRAVPNVTVSFVTSGGATVDAATKTTGSNGAASVVWTLGSTFGQRTLTASVQGLPSVTFTANTIAPDAGVLAFNLVDPVGDTTQNQTGVGHAAQDIVSIRGDFKRDSLIVVATFNAPISADTLAANAIGGYLEIDIDDNPHTGFEALANLLGGSANLGIEYDLEFFGFDGASLLLYDASSFAPVKATYAGNAVTVRIPMNRLSNDDGNFGLSGIIGNTQRPTDIFPNTGQTTVRRGVVDGSSLSILPQSGDLLNSSRIIRSWGAARPKLRMNRRLSR